MPCLTQCEFFHSQESDCGNCGLSGAGKSTVLQLTEQFYELTDEEIDIYGSRLPG